MHWGYDFCPTAVTYKEHYRWFDDQACRGAPRLSGLMKEDKQKGLNLCHYDVDCLHVFKKGLQIPEHLKQKPQTTQGCFDHRFHNDISNAQNAPAEKKEKTT